MIHKKNIPSATAIIVAAGSGSRMGENTNKQFILIDEIPVLAHTLLKFNSAETIDSIIVVTKPENILAVNDIIREFDISKAREVVAGGETRQDSVFCGLNYVENDRLVAIHDGARPFISVEKINELVCAAHKFGSAAPGVVPKDTVKMISKDNSIDKTINRQTLRLIQTPQVFHADTIKLALIQAKENGLECTDDCSAAEHMGVSVHIVDGEYTNIKVTTPEDIPMAEAICKFLNI